MDVGWLEKAELKPTQPSLAGAWLSLAIFLLLNFAKTKYVEGKISIDEFCQSFCSLSENFSENDRYKVQLGLILSGHENRGSRSQKLSAKSKSFLGTRFPGSRTFSCSGLNTERMEDAEK